MKIKISQSRMTLKKSGSLIWICQFLYLYIVNMIHYYNILILKIKNSPKAKTVYKIICGYPENIWRAKINDNKIPQTIFPLSNHFAVNRIKSGINAADSTCPFHCDQIRLNPEKAKIIPPKILPDFETFQYLKSKYVKIAAKTCWDIICILQAVNKSKIKYKKFVGENGADWKLAKNGVPAKI